MRLPIVINSNFALSDTVFEILTLKARKWLIRPRSGGTRKLEGLGLPYGENA